MNQSTKGILKKHFADQSYEIRKEYLSKKNTVVLINSNKEFFIIKVFHSSNKKGMQRETQILSILPSNINHPKIYQIDHENNLIRIEYINGKNLCDLLHDIKISIDEKNKIIDQLAVWFVSFHQLNNSKKNVLLKGDAHIRNFIVSDKLIFGVDFEEAKNGQPSIDIADCCVSILLSTPILTDEKINWCKRLKNTYQICVSRILDDFEMQLNTSLTNTIKRRTNQKELYKAVSARKDIMQKIIHS